MNIGWNLSGGSVLRMIAAFAVTVILIGVLLAAWFLRAHSGLRTALSRWPG
jgi:hypothetical protein